MTLDDVLATTTGRSRSVLEYAQITKRLVDSAKEAGFTVESWAPLAELIAVDEFVRIGPFKVVMNWDDYAIFLTNWAKSSDWVCSFQRITETTDLVFLELEERSHVGDFSSVVNTVSVYEFNADDKVRRIAVYLQMELPTTGTVPSFEEGAAVKQPGAVDAQRLSDELEITALLNRYARAVDTKDWELYRTVFTEDAVIDYSSAGIPAGSRDEIAEMFTQAFAAVPWTMHYITNIEADIDGDTARVRAMFHNPMQLPGMREQSSCGGYYFHDLVRTAEGWRSRHLREDNVWFVNRPGDNERL